MALADRHVTREEARDSTDFMKAQRHFWLLHRMKGYVVLYLCVEGVFRGIDQKVRRVGVRGPGDIAGQLEQRALDHVAPPDGCR